MGDSIDLEHAVDELAQARALHEVPFSQANRLPANLVLVVDMSDRLQTLLEDQIEVIEWLRMIKGPHGLRVIPVTSGREAFQRLNREQLNSGAAVLLLTDFGSFGTIQDKRSWDSAASLLAERDIAPVLLAPGLAENRVRSGRSIRWDDRGATRASAAELASWAQRLAIALSDAVRIEPRLLRAVRRRWQGLDPSMPRGVALEIAFTRLAEVETIHPREITLRPEEAARLRAEQSTLPEALRRSADDVLDAWRRDVVPVWWAQEVVVRAVRDPGTVDTADLAKARAILERLASTICKMGRPDDDDTGVAHCLQRLSERGAEELLDDEVVGPAIRKAAAHLRNPIPQSGDGSPRVLVQRSGILRVLPALVSPREAVAPWRITRSVGADPSADDSMMAHFFAAETPAAISVREDGLWRVEESASPLRSHADALRVFAGAAELTLERIEKPWWASAMGRDPFGLWVECLLAGVPYRMRWIPPGRFWRGSPQEETAGLDRFRAEHVSEEDARRWLDREHPRHEVVISRGFWLGEVPVTQDVWEAVMGKNPSRFVSAQRPVDGVSWEDCDAFVRAVQQGFGGGDADSDTAKRSADAEEWRFATETEWEYACRAGTDTATYAGPFDINGVADAPSLDFIAWYSGNCGVEFDLEEGHESSDWPEKQYDHQKAGTREVRGKRPNAWGLYDMLGNVWEWCGDWLGDYEDGRQVDPPGPPEGSSRVLRGGSWDAIAQGVRAAYRSAVHPGFRSSDRGFRLARGQAVSSRQEPAEPAGQTRRRTGRRGTRRVRGRRGDETS